MNAEEIAGRYYRGDRLSVNQNLRLHIDGTYTCSWTGCIGTYGKTAGTGAIVNDQLVFDASVTEGHFVDKPLGPFETIRDDDGDLLLVPLTGVARDYYNKTGPSLVTCFVRQGPADSTPHSDDGSDQ